MSWPMILQLVVHCSPKSMFEAVTIIGPKTDRTTLESSIVLTTEWLPAAIIRGN